MIGLSCLVEFHDIYGMSFCLSRRWILVQQESLIDTSDSVSFMLAHTHIIINTAVGAMLVWRGIFTFDAFLMFVAGGILFDIDHLFYFIFAERTLSITKMAAVGRNLLATHTPKLYIFHTIEFFSVFLSLAIFNPFLMPLFLGLALHLLLDILNYQIHGKRFSWMPYWSITYMMHQELSKHYKSVQNPRQ
jgi:hypothetical protein